MDDDQLGDGAVMIFLFVESFLGEGDELAVDVNQLSDGDVHHMGLVYLGVEITV